MELVETIVTATGVLLRLADNAAHDEATEWLDIAVKTNPDLTHPLIAIQGDALQRARNAIDAEIRRLQLLASRNP